MKFFGRTSLGVCIALAAACSSPPPSEAPAQSQDVERPNIIVILADDLGYMDVTAFAHRLTGEPIRDMFYETPNLDRLAAQGAAFSQAYANPLCSPSRAALLTGRFAPRMGFTTAVPLSTPTWYNQGKSPPAGVHALDMYRPVQSAPPDTALVSGLSQTALYAGGPMDGGRNETTIAEALGDYQSVFLGKWHLGGQGAEDYQPFSHGFEVLAYYDAGGSPYFDWRGSWDRRSLIHPAMPQEQLRIGIAGYPSELDYLTDDLTLRAVEFLHIHADSERPFLLFVSHFAVHTPLEAKTERRDYFESRGTRGWNGQDNPTYAAMVSSLDDSVGAIMAALADTGLDENTWVIFMSDNGGVDYVIEDGVAHRGPDPERLPTSNAPLKGGKATLFEGGVRVPLVIWKKDAGFAGAWIDAPVDASDLFPTMLELAGRDGPSADPSPEIDGRSLLPFLEERGNTGGAYEKDAIYWHYPFNVVVPHPEDGLPLTPHSAIRRGAHKLIVDWHGRLRLYDIDNDPFEQNDLSQSRPELARELFVQLAAWLDENVEPRYRATRNPAYDPSADTRRQPYVDLRELLGVPQALGD